jgi:GNAT superfamily N-acetyltransferase
MRLIPDSWGSTLREANDCHEPAGSSKGGQFCSKGGGLEGDAAVAAIKAGQPHLASEQAFVDYHVTGHIKSGAYAKYEEEGVDFIRREEFPDLLQTVRVNGESVEIRLRTTPLRHSVWVPASPDADRLYNEYEAAARALGTNVMMAGIDLGRDSPEYEQLAVHERRWRAALSHWATDANGDLIPMSPEEIAAKKLPLNGYTVAAFVGDKAIGYADDEFGATGVYLMREYQRHGIGLTLLRTYLEKSGRLAKGRKLGQMTHAGVQLTRALHRQLVRDRKTFREANDCHEPAGSPNGGQFCSKDGGLVPGDATYAATTSSPEFRAWFKGSKVVDAQGQPLVVYHGTNANPDMFRPGTHFGTAKAAQDRADALITFSRDVVHRPTGPFQTIPVYLRVRNPLRLPDMADVDTYTGLSMEEATARYRRKNPDDPDLEGDEAPRARRWEDDEDVVMTLHEQGVITRDEFWEHQYDSTLKVFALLKQKGYDGIVYENAVEDAGSDSWIVFHPRQVKSALANRTFTRRAKRFTEGR